MNHRYIKLLALAVMCGCSLIAFAIHSGGVEGLLFFGVFVLSGIWFLLYWIISEGPGKAR